MTGRTGILAAVLAVVAAAAWLLGGREIAAEVVYPAENAGGRISRSIGARIRAVFSGGSLAAENASLRREVETLKMAVATAAETERENRSLRRMLGMDGSEDGPHLAQDRWICADILSRGGVFGRDGTMRVGKGSLAGVVRGAVVAVPWGLVGRVDSVSLHTSTIRLVTDPSLRISCEIETAPGSPPLRGIVSGGGLRTAGSGMSVLYLCSPLRVKNLALRPEPQPGAKIVTSGLGGVFPRGLAVGTLADSVRSDETGLEREGAAVPAVDFPALERVFIRRER